LTAYNGQVIAYDAIGNPLNYRDGMVFAWQNGRELASLQQGDFGVSYTYYAAGLQMSKSIWGKGGFAGWSLLVIHWQTILTQRIKT
jgi:hypothetical protein